MTGKSVRGSPAAEDREAPEGGGATGGDIAEETAAALAKAEEYLGMAQRLQADFDNYRKRVQKENEEFRRCAADDIIRDLLPAIDDIDRALESVDGEDELSAGFRAVRRNVMRILEDRGLREIPVDGGFDPGVHEALCVVAGEEDGRVGQVFQKGYTVDGRVIRSAKVAVTRKEENKE